MPTTRTVTVKNTGGDYTTVAAALSAETKDLVANDRILVIELFSSAGAQGVINVTGFTTDVTRYVEITAPAGERHAGAWDTAKARFVASPGYDAPVVQAENTQFVKFSFLQIESGTAHSSSALGVRTYGSGTSTITFDRCIIRNTGSKTSPDGGAGISPIGTTAYTLRFVRCLVQDFNNGIFVGTYNSAGITLLLYGCSFVGNTSNSVNLTNVDGGAVVRVKNVLIQQPIGMNWTGPSGGTTEYVSILTQDATSPSVPLRSKTVSFVGSGDFTPQAGDISARDAGTDLSTDTYWPHSTDLAGYAVTGAWDVGALEYQSAVTALTIATQPTTTASGYLITPAPVVNITTNGTDIDTDATDDVTVELIGSGGVLLGTTTVAAVAGVATFDDLRPCEAGTYALRFSVAGYADVDSSSFSVTTGGGSTTLVIGGDMSSVQIRRNEATASLRRIPLTIRDDAGAAWAGSVTGVKAKLSVNGAAETDSPADIVRVAGTRHYVELAQPYTDIPEGSVISARVIADTGRLEASSDAQVIPADSYADAVSETSLVRSIVRAANGADGFEIVRDPDNSQIQLNIPGVGVVNIPATFAQNAPAVTSLGVA